MTGTPYISRVMQIAEQENWNASVRCFHWKRALGLLQLSNLYKDGRPNLLVESFDGRGGTTPPVPFVMYYTVQTVISHVPYTNNNPVYNYTIIR